MVEGRVGEFLVALSWFVRVVGTYRADSSIGTVLSCETSPPPGQHGTERRIRARSAMGARLILTNLDI